MKAVLYKEPGIISVEEVPRPQIQEPEDAIIKITKTAICGSDLHMFHGYLGVLPDTIIGHEFTGVVEEVGPSVTAVRPGDRVLGAAGIACGQCKSCRDNLVVACKHLGIYGCGPLFGDLPGAQAEYIKVQFANFTLEKIPDGLTDEQVLFVGDILSTAYMGALGITPGSEGITHGSTVAVFGAGPVGLCAVAVSHLFGPARIIAVDKLDYRLEMAANLGADHVINVLMDDPVEVISNITDDWGADFVIESTGETEVLEQCFTAVAPGGIVSAIAVYHGPVELPIHFILPKNIGVKMGLANLVHTKKLIKLIECGKLDLTPIITHRLPLSEAQKGYKLFDEKLDGCIKVILEP
ncbi:MAG: alcohol dehydrogenase catalytic domain-containing protein [Bacillota bacterium]